MRKFRPENSDEAEHSPGIAFGYEMQRADKHTWSSPVLNAVSTLLQARRHALAALPAAFETRGFHNISFCFRQLHYNISSSIVMSTTSVAVGAGCSRGRRRGSTQWKDQLKHGKIEMPMKERLVNVLGCFPEAACRPRAQVYPCRVTFRCFRSPSGCSFPKKRA